MKWFTLAFFAVASVTSALWYESAERKHTREQRRAYGVVAVASWFLMVLLGSVML
jgi:hypothetical protein